MSSPDEPFGTTPIPTSVHGRPLCVTLDLSAKHPSHQQPQTNQIAVYEATRPTCQNGSLLDVNQHFVVYAVKNGLIRVLHRHSAMRALLRGHLKQTLSDISFFLDGDVLGTVGSSEETGQSTLIVWRVFEHSPDIQSEKLLEIPSPQGVKMSRIMWHPFNPNQFWLFHTSPNSQHQVATLVETTRIQTVQHPEGSHAVCKWHSPTSVMEDAVQLSSIGSLTDLAWSGRDTRHVLTVHDKGEIILWDVKQVQQQGQQSGGAATPLRLAIVNDTDAPELSRCLFLPHENATTKEHQTDTLTTCFVTASQQNSVITLWSSFTASEDPTKLQVIRLANPSPTYILDLCFGPAPQDASPPSSFLLWADRHQGQVLAIHVQSQWNADQKALCVGSDYVVPFTTKHPVFSWSVVCSPTQDISDDDIAEHAGLIFDMKLFSYQSKEVQCLTLTSYMCLPPEHGYHENNNSVVTVEPLAGGGPSAFSPSAELGTDGEPEYDEEYDVGDEDEDDDDNDGEENDAMASPDANTLPSPNDNGAHDNNPFANWLGAIATGGASSNNNTTTNNNASIPDPPMPPPPPGMGMGAPPGLAPDVVRSASASSTSSQQHAFLNPMDFLTKTDATPTTNNGPEMTKKPENSQKKKGGKKNNSRSKSPKAKKNNNNNNKNSNPANPFPDGAKIQILKRENKSPLPPSPPPPPTPAPHPDAAVVSMPPPPPLPHVENVVVAAVPQTSTADLEAALTRVVSQELASSQPNVAQQVEDRLVKSLVPAVRKVVEESLGSFGRPLQSSIHKLGEQGIRVQQDDLKAALDIETPIKAALADSMRHVFIPAFESMTSQVLQQVKPPPPSNDARETKALVEAMSKQLSTMMTKMDHMTQELDILKKEMSAVAASSGGNGTPMPPNVNGMPGGMPNPPPPPNNNMAKIEAIRNEINGHLQQHQYEAAFTKALSSNVNDMSVYCCSRANLGSVFAGPSGPQLSQPILLCLMQQLGAALVTQGVAHSPEYQVELAWLQEIALTLNPTDPNIQRHVPTVLQQLVASINTKMAQNNPNLRRPLQMLLQVIRGMQMG